MVDALIPMAIRRKASFETHPPLIDDYEIAACIGLICKDLNLSLPDSELLSDVQTQMLAQEGVPEEYLKLLSSRDANNTRKDWRRLMQAGKEYWN